MLKRTKQCGSCGEVYTSVTHNCPDNEPDSEPYDTQYNYCTECGFLSGGHAVACSQSAIRRANAPAIVWCAECNNCDGVHHAHCSQQQLGDTLLPLDLPVDNDDIPEDNISEESLHHWLPDANEQSNMVDTHISHTGNEYRDDCRLCRHMISHSTHRPFYRFNSENRPGRKTVMTKSVLTQDNSDRRKITDYALMRGVSVKWSYEKTMTYKITIHGRKELVTRILGYAEGLRDRNR